MIETVINLRGEPEKFDAKKLNHWVQDVVGVIKAEEWSDIALETVRGLPEEVTVQKLMKSLIDALLARSSWSHYLMAGRLLAILNRIEIYGSKELPTVREVQSRLNKAGLMRDLKYSDYEWSIIESMIDHEQDMNSPHFALEQIRFKYSLQDFADKKEFETPQFVYMRMAMAIYESYPETDPGTSLDNEDPSKRSRLEHVIRSYRLLSKKSLSAPTPNYNNLGTYHRGYASCCLIAQGDDRWSLAAGDHITYMMTTQSAGIGINLMTRSLGDKVQKGRFEHRGKLPYIATFGKNIRANLQGGRGGAGTLYFNLFDPEARKIAGLRDTRAVDTARNRDAHYAYMGNRFLAMKMANNEEIFTWNIKTAPELHDAFYGPDVYKFAEIYNKLEKDPTFVKNYVSARSLVVYSISQGIATGTIYAADIGEMNRNTPYLDPIRSSNLCLEVSEPTEPYVGRSAMADLMSTVEVGHARFEAIAEDGEQCYFDMKASDTLDKPEGSRIVAQDIKVGNEFLYLANPFKLEDIAENAKVKKKFTVNKVLSIKREPEVALCSLAAANITEELTDAEYEELMYYAYKMIDYCIYENDYVLPHMGVTAKARMNAGVGIMGIATHMARRKLKFNSKEGLKELHRVFERHLWFAIKASLKISKERGLAPWIGRTKLPEGWTPLKDYRREVDELADFEYQYDWDAISEEIKANGGLAHSVLVNFMPGESSSKALGAVNSIYGIRKLVINKVDADNVLRWAAPYGDDPEYEYQSMWDLTIQEQNNIYAIAQKFCDQSVSADWFINFTNRLTFSSSEIIEAELDRITKGIKTRYYINTLMPARQDSLKISKSAHSYVPQNYDVSHHDDNEVKQNFMAAADGSVSVALDEDLMAELSAHGIVFGTEAVEGGDGHMSCAGCDA